MRACLLIFVIPVLIAVFLMYPGVSPAGEKKSVRFKENYFFVELAQTKKEQERGLMFIDRLAPDSGMLFVYRDEAPRSFYTKNTYLPLDMIWMDKEMKVVFIKKNAHPGDSRVYETISPQEKAMYVLELNAGCADRAGIKIGDKLEL